MLNFCTLFDANYLTRGLALYESLKNVCPQFYLYVVAFDDNCYSYLKGQQLDSLTVVSLAEFEDEELLKVKPTRSIAEYCWTCTPSIILYCLRQFKLDHCTYIDADMIFYSNPQLLIDEMGRKSVLISEHRYTRMYDQSAYSGIYCVQFMCFKNNTDGLHVLSWWRNRCLEWCYARHEDGKFGDQKYLDDWTARFDCVHVMQHLGGGVAPWNVQQYKFSKQENDITVEKKMIPGKYTMVFFHFHGLKFYTGQKLSLCGFYELDAPTIKLFYFPYIKALLNIEQRLLQHNISFNPSGAREAAPQKTAIFIQYLKTITSRVITGKTSLFNLKIYNFSRHYHFYDLHLFH